LKTLRARGVRELSYFQVDNPLARPADTLFLGLHALRGAEMSSKVVKKRNAGEKVGVLGRIDGRMGCIEYSDLPARLREQRHADGELAFRAGNIAVHLLRREFVERLTAERLELPWHLARKKVRVIDARGDSVEAFGTKFETFVFDALGRTTASVTLEVDRALEFSPVKNAEGEDSPATCRRDLCRMFAGWAAAAGRALPEPDAAGVHPVEVDPRVAESRAEFLSRDRKPEVSARGHLYR
jgi:UDP-N-acetylglucosamine/UDP-N-acetylgalactosamine diphosphorylase